MLVPFPFAAEDHQTVNAQHLVDKQAAILVRTVKQRGAGEYAVHRAGKRRKRNSACLKGEISESWRSANADEVELRGDIEGVVKAMW